MSTPLVSGIWCDEQSSVCDWCWGALICKICQTFSTSCKILSQILILYFDWVVMGRRDFFSFMNVLLLSILAPLLLFSSVQYLISFLLVPCASVRINTLAWVPPFLYSYGVAGLPTFSRSDTVDGGQLVCQNQFW